MCVCASLCAVSCLSLLCVLLEPTYLWFTFQLCFFPSSVSASFFLPFSFISCLLFGFFCALKNFTECGNRVAIAYVCLLQRETHAARPVRPHQYSLSALLPREFSDAVTQISFCALSRKGSGAYKKGCWDSN